MERLEFQKYTDAGHYDNPDWGIGYYPIHARGFDKVAATVYIPSEIEVCIGKLKPRPEGVYVLVHAMGASEAWGCFTPGTPVLTRSGKYEKIEDIKIGDEVLTSTGNFDKVKTLWTHTEHKEGIKLTVEGLPFPITTTPNHVFMSVSREDIACVGDKYKRCIPETWGTQAVCNRKAALKRNCAIDHPLRVRDTKAEFLAIKDYLVAALPHHIELQPEKYWWHDTDIATMLGLWVAEGNFRRNKKGIRTELEFTFSDQETYLINTVIKAANKLGASVAGPYKGHGKCTRIIVRNKQLAENVYTLFGEHARHKTVPGTWASEPKEIIAAFLGGYFDGDGTWNNRNSMETANTASFSLALGIQRLCWAIGVPCCVCHVKSQNSYHVSFSLERGNIISKYSQNMGTYIPKGKSHFRQFFFDGHAALPIRKIESVSLSTETYDLEVEGNHTYNVLQVACHNSNLNGDRFPEWSCKGDPPPPHIVEFCHDRGLPIRPIGEYGYKTFLKYAYVYKQHKNTDPMYAIGEQPVAAAWNDQMKRIELILFIFEARAPESVRKIKEGAPVYWSMGARLSFDVCLAKGTHIYTPEGSRPIEEIKEGDLVFTHKGRCRPVNKTYQRSYTGNVVELKIKGLPNRLSMTDNHPVFVYRKNTLRRGNGRRMDMRANIIEGTFIAAREIEVGDYVAVPKLEVDTSGYDTIDPDLARLCGYYLGDGHVDTVRRGEKRDGSRDFIGISITCGDHEKEHIARVVDVLEKFSEKKVHVYPSGYDKKAVRVCCADPYLATRIAGMCGTKKEKRLPPGIFSSPIESRLSLLGGLIDTDGYFDRKKSNARITITIDGLMESVQLLALSTGLAATMSRIKVDTTFIKGSHTNQLNIGSTGVQLLTKYSVKCSFLVPKTRWGATAVERSDSFLFPVQEIKTSKVVELPVFNLGVEEDETYIPGFIVHNCTICHNAARSRDEYCRHLKYEMGKILPDGRQVSASNLFPRLFDISDVVKPADESAFTLRKIAAVSDSVWDPRRTYHECPAGMIKTAQYVDEFSDPKVAENKTAEITKHVESTSSESLGSTPINPKVLSILQNVIRKDESVSPNLSGDMLSEIKKDPPKGLATITMIGIKLKPKEVDSIFPSPDSVPTQLDFGDISSKLLNDMSPLIKSRTLFDPLFSDRVRMGDVEPITKNATYTKYESLLRSLDVNDLVKAANSPLVFDKLDPYFTTRLLCKEAAIDDVDKVLNFLISLM